MYRIKALTVCAWAGVLFTGLSATAQQLGPPDQRRDWYELRRHEQDLRRYAEADCIGAKYVDLQRVNATTYELKTKGWNQEVPNPGSKICSSTRFLGQQTGGRASAVLVGPNKVLTAEHTFPDAIACRDRWLVFGHFQKGPNNPPVDATGGSAKILVPAANVYKCQDWFKIPGGDLVLLTLDRKVENGRRPLKINRDGGTLEVGTPVVSMGHPQSLPLKIDQGMVTYHGSPGAPIGSSVHAAIRSSGSMLVDRGRGVLTGIVVRHQNWLSCPSNSCCADNTGWFTYPAESEDVSLAAKYVPPIGLNTTGKGLVEMHGPIWGNFANESTEYTISNSRDEPGSIAYEVRLDQDSGLFTLNRGTAPIFGRLAPGASRTFTVETVPRRGFYPIGIHDATISIVDNSYGTTDFRKHRLYVGTNSYLVDPEEGFYGAGPGAIASETTRYTIKNRHLGSQEIHISTSDSWLRVNNISSPFALYVPGISQGGTEFVQVSLDDTSLSKGLHRGEITLDSYPFDGTFAVTREVLLDAGREIYTTAGPVDISPGDRSVSVPITLPSGGRFQDIDVEIHMDHHPQALINGPIEVELISPPIVGGAPIELSLYVNPRTSRVNLNEVFDDVSNPLPTVDSLSSLENTPFQSGDWMLRISRGGGMQGSGTVHSASLRVTRAPSISRLTR